MSKYNGSKKAAKTKTVPKGMPKRLDNPNDDYQRKTSTKMGKQTMWYLTRADFEKVQRACLVHLQKAKKGSNNEYRWERNYLILMVGVNMGCRTTTVLEITPRLYAGGKFYVREHKTGKTQNYELKPEIYKLLNDFSNKYKFTKDEYIFRTRIDSANKPLTREQAWRIVKGLADEAGIKYNVGAYSLRKSFARWLYDDTHDIFKVMRVMQHSDPIITARYICLEEEEVMKIRESILYGFDNFKNV
ncbi:MAG: tyrosine-type recombinase/integrase [Solobacterium sp.]|jgi:integrase|nr:tyrosine-type recombinase/integrase [Solobacterium sp.]MCH4205300.1 tyrosine-type recombinase/integrase [Solobacterium sp.]MCH4226893.1 tyrosine-type recombinase/integrase [Solobacterium sp.]MCH4281653.1 tyrosine-type recombinase/integrase [Solobacterium sp.]